MSCLYDSIIILLSFLMLDGGEKILASWNLQGRRGKVRFHSFFAFRYVELRYQELFFNFSSKLNVIQMASSIQDFTRFERLTCLFLRQICSTKSI